MADNDKGKKKKKKAPKSGAAVELSDEDEDEVMRASCRQSDVLKGKVRIPLNEEEMRSASNWLV